MPTNPDLLALVRSLGINLTDEKSVKNALAYYKYLPEQGRFQYRATPNYTDNLKLIEGTKFNPNIRSATWQPSWRQIGDPAEQEKGRNEELLAAGRAAQAQNVAKTTAKPKVTPVAKKKPNLQTLVTTNYGNPTGPVMKGGAPVRPAVAQPVIQKPVRPAPNPLLNQSINFQQQQAPRPQANNYGLGVTAPPMRSPYQPNPMLRDGGGLPQPQPKQPIRTGTLPQPQPKQPVRMDGGGIPQPLPRQPMKPTVAPRNPLLDQYVLQGGKQVAPRQGSTYQPTGPYGYGTQKKVQQSPAARAPTKPGIDPFAQQMITEQARRNAANPGTSVSMEDMTPEQLKQFRITNPEIMRQIYAQRAATSRRGG